MNKKTLHLLISILFLFFGILISLQFKSVQRENILTNNIQNDTDRLKQLLKQEKDKSISLNEQLKLFEKKQETFENKLLNSKETEILKNELDKARFVAGLTDVSGNGIIIKLDDSKKRLEEGINPERAILHDSDLLDIVNILNSSGAQAISLNNQRLVSTSEIQCAGPTISVNHVRCAVPFEIKVIGDPDYLIANLETPGNIIDLMKFDGIQIEIVKQNNILISKFRDIFNNNVTDKEAS